MLDQPSKVRVCTIIEQWNEPQAVANLLMYPVFIPQELRKKALLRGLHEPLTYLTLAAMIGLQGHSDWWSNVDRIDIVERLHSITFGAPYEFANRASVTLFDYVLPEDAERLIFSLGSPNAVVQHNSLLALLRLFGREEVRRRVTETFVAKRVTLTGRDYVATNIDTLNADDLPLLGYIPNLNDFSK